MNTLPDWILPVATGFFGLIAGWVKCRNPIQDGPVGFVARARAIIKSITFAGWILLALVVLLSGVGARKEYLQGREDDAKHAAVLGRLEELVLEAQTASDKADGVLKTVKSNALTAQKNYGETIGQIEEVKVSEEASLRQLEKVVTELQKTQDRKLVALKQRDRIGKIRRTLTLIQHAAEISPSIPDKKGMHSLLDRAKEIASDECKELLDSLHGLPETQKVAHMSEIYKYISRFSERTMSLINGEHGATINRIQDAIDAVLSELEKAITADLDSHLRQGE